METGDGGERTDSQNLRSFLRVKEEDHMIHGGAGSGNGPGVTLNSVLADKRGPGEVLRTQSNRTLLDIIREESGNKDGKKSWRHFKDKLRLRRTGSGSAWTSSVPIPTSDIPIHHNNSNRNPPMNRRPSTGFGDSGESTQFDSSAASGLQSNSSRVSGRFEHTSSLAIRRLQRERNDNEEEEEEGRRSGDTEEEEEGSGEGEGGGDGQPVRMSLMSLLAETDRQMGLDGSAFMMEDDDDEEDEEEEEESGGGGEYNTCCICMVRHKGAAFIPCGHTFCRMCSRELWVQRGHCPLCNNYILEILDIF